VLDDVQATWSGVFEASGLSYQTAQLVLYRDAVESACGVAPAATGPFYCPADANVYLDLSFYDTLRERYGASGDFAEAYVIAHEIGHHVQHQIGTMEAMRRAQQERPEAANELSVALELQADCYAGVWGASVDARAARARRPRGGARGSRGGRRRPPRRPRRPHPPAGDLHARLVGATHALVPDRLRHGRSGRLRHLRRALSTSS
jgi:hypothetical protein